jgi:mRNA interferase MazF
MIRGGVWWLRFDQALGSEIQKTRPAVIISKDLANRHLPRVVVVPLTSNVKKLYPGNALVTINGTASKALTDQIMTADKTRLTGKIGQLSPQEMLSLENALKIHLALK